LYWGDSPKAKWADRDLFFHRGRWNKGEDPNKSKLKNCAVRSQRWRFVNNKELYDISSDPLEKQLKADGIPEWSAPEL